MKTAVIQFAPTEDTQENLGAIENYLRQCAAEGVRLAVFPEFALFTADALDKRFVESAVSIDGPEVSTLVELSTELNIAVICGINEHADGEKIYNTILGIDGEIRTIYRKIHLYDAFGCRESNIVIPGQVSEPAIFQVDGFKIGIHACYDLRFPEHSRYVVEQGANVLVFPSEWVPGPLKEFQWTTLLTARAIENLSYVIGADQSAKSGSGCSAIIDPMGVTLANLGERVGIGIAELSLERINQVRQTNPALEMRRLGVQPLS